MKGVLAWLSRQSRARVFVLSLLAVPALGVADHLSGPEISSSIFYVLPVAAAAWFVSRPAASAVAVLSAATWYAADASGPHEYSSSWIPAWNAAVRLGFFVVIGRLLLELRARLDEEERLADTDALTGALNRRHFYERVQLEVDRAGRFRHASTLAYVDLDDFKRVNDSLGHAAGDDLLRRIVAALRATVRPQDLIARLGGDEFAVLFVETPAASVPKLVERIRAGLGALEPPVSASIGVVTYDEPPPDVEFMVKRADALMYQVKRTAKNGVLLGRWPEPSSGSGSESDGARRA